MYASFFNLKEMPFSITPDPAYLYLSARHQEALGHLLYGTGEYGGFVQLTGEVGTGKTTVVRTLLEQQLQDVDVAMVHNPRLDEREFVQAVCDELRVDYPKGKDVSLKQLIDALNKHLLQAHANGRRTVLIIDEAQNLDRDVLEQVRLLTNLETPKAKLLRIMLIGQPELQELLARPDLRQLSSRITARYHLMPLDERETGEYIRHRLRVAGTQDEVFNPGAIREVHNITRGVPRLINVLCDRSMLGAFGEGARRVTPEIVRHAANESVGTPGSSTPSPPQSRVGRLDSWSWLELTVAGLAAVLAIVLVWRTFLSHPTDAPATASTTADAPVRHKPTPATVASAAEASAAAAPSAAEPAKAGAAATATPGLPPEIDLTSMLQLTEPLPLVLSRLIRAWDTQVHVPRGQNVCSWLENVKLECYKATGEWLDLRQMDRPAVLSLTTGRGDLDHVLLLGLTDTTATLASPQGPMRVPLQDLDALWTGEFLLLWRRETQADYIGPGSSGSDVVWLRKRLAAATGNQAIDNGSPQFDALLQDALRGYQQTTELNVDGLAGVRTLISLGDINPNTPKLDTRS